MKLEDANTLKKQIEAINALVNQEVFDCRLEEPDHGTGFEVHVYRHEGPAIDREFNKIQTFREYGEGNAWIHGYTYTLTMNAGISYFENASGRLVPDVSFRIPVANDLMDSWHNARTIKCPDCGRESYVEAPRPEDANWTTMRQSFTCPDDECGHEGVKVWTDGMTQIMEYLKNRIDVTPQV